MKLYIGNATKQVLTFAYRVPEMNGVRTQTIAVGSQVMLSGDLSTKQIDAIVDQNRKYGLVPVDEVDRARDFVGICFSIDKPISSSKLTLAMQRNTDVLVERGKQNRKAAALAVNGQIQSDLAEHDGLGASLKSLEMSTVEEEPKGGYRTTKPIGEGVRIERDPSAPKEKAPRKPRPPKAK